MGTKLLESTETKVKVNFSKLKGGKTTMDNSLLQLPTLGSTQ